MATSTYVSVIYLSVNILNATIERPRVTEWIKKNKNKTNQDPSLCCLQKTHLRPKAIRTKKGRGGRNCKLEVKRPGQQYLQ